MRTVTSYVDQRGNIHKTPREATIANIAEQVATEFDSYDLGDTNATELATFIVDKRASLIPIMYELEDVLANESVTARQVYERQFYTAYAHKELLHEATQATAPALFVETP